MARGERKGIKEGIKEEGGVGREGGRGVEMEEVEEEEEVAAEKEGEKEGEGTQAETEDMRMGIPLIGSLRKGIKEAIKPS